MRVAATSPGITNRAAVKAALEPLVLGAPSGDAANPAQPDSGAVTIDGHDVRQVLGALDQADSIHAQPTAIIAHTTKGRGVGFMEYDHRFHGGAPTDEQHERALVELEEGLTAWSD